MAAVNADSTSAIVRKAMTVLGQLGSTDENAAMIVVAGM